MKPVLVFIASAALVPVLLWAALRFFSRHTLADRPNERSLHQVATPRYGGLAIALAVALLLSAEGALTPGGNRAAMLWLAALAAPLVLISFFDDWSPLPIALRLSVHAAAATALLLLFLGQWIPTGLGAGGSALPLQPLGVIAPIVLVVWCTNLFNFMDGADGLAGGMALIGFGTYAWAAGALPQGQSIALFATAIAGAALGFLMFNFPPARVFMGDAGAIPLGFLAAALGIHGAIAGLWSGWFGVIVFSPFLVDATVTLMTRIARREKFWRAHRQHYYQRLILAGWSHRQTALSYYFLMLGSALSALFAQKLHLYVPILAFWVITYASLLLYAEWRLLQNKKNQEICGTS